ncbi:MAG: hypothetical protein EOP04_28795 [Proteobacteria bacterium]|nr:MAG: hypothetical protein EOP04_28795 [Pseudomonadota bacterium]
MFEPKTFEELSKRAYSYLRAQQDAINVEYELTGYEDWFYDQYKRTLTFSSKGVDKLVIDYENVGSLSQKSNTWLWAWDNPNVEATVKSEIGMVRDFGQRNNFEKLITAKWTADEYDAWEMTAIAAYLMQAKGAYRVPLSDNLLLSFMIYKEVRWADLNKLGR